tara:strand:+ start:188 stop:745 length:558 start_codon:yes stop_codon:yes gene_type:complete
VASQLSSGDLISSRYALALYDLANESKNLDHILKDLKLIKSIIEENKNLKLLFKSPLISSVDKLKITEKIIINQNTNQLTNTFLKVVSNNKRFAKLYSIIIHFIDINSQKRGDILADITSADELTDIQQKQISEKLKSILGDKLSLNFFVDKKIIGGLIVKVGSKMIDLSLSSKINKLNIAMKGA